MSKLIVGLSSRVARRDREANIAKSIRGSGRPRPTGRSWWCSRNCTPAPISARPRTPRCFDLAEPIPGPSTERLRRAGRGNWASSSSPRSSSGAPPGSTTTPPWSWRRTARSPAGTARCTSPTIPATTRNSISPPATSASTPIDTSVGRLGVLVCWDQWYPEAARLMALAGADLLIYPTAIGWDPHDTAGGTGPPAAMPG